MTIWYVDPKTGNDGNSGLSLDTALATEAETLKRSERRVEIWAMPERRDEWENAHRYLASRAIDSRTIKGV